MTSNFLNTLKNQIEDYHERPIFGEFTVAEALVRTPVSARDATSTPKDKVPHVKHHHSPQHLQRLLQRAMAQHQERLRGEHSDDETEQLPHQRRSPLHTTAGSLTARPRLGGSTSGTKYGRRSIDYWEEECVWEALERAGAGVQLLSANWLLKEAAKGPSATLPRRGKLPPRAKLSLEDVRRIHRAASSNPLTGGSKRLPIIAVAVEGDEATDGKALLELLGWMLRPRLPRYATPHGNAHPAAGPSDMAVYVDYASLTEREASNPPLRGVTARTIATLFAHRLVTVYVGSAPAEDADARACLLRHLAGLCKRASDPMDPWPMLCHVDNTAARKAAKTLPVPLPPAAFEPTGALACGLARVPHVDAEAIDDTYRCACEDTYSGAHSLDFSRPADVPRDASWGDREMYRLAELLPLCHMLKELRLGGHGKLTHLPDSIGDIPPPPPRPFVRGMPSRAATSAYASLQTLDVRDSPKLTRLPDALAKLANLRTLTLDWCVHLHHLPDAMGELRCLRTLSMCGCEIIHSLPESLADLKVRLLLYESTHPNNPAPPLSG